MANHFFSFNNGLIKLNFFQKSARAYLSLMKSFLNDKKHPRFQVSGLLFQAKQWPKFVDSFSSCSVMKGYNSHPRHLRYMTENRISTLLVILKSNISWNPNKFRGHSNLSVRMTDICGKSIGRLLESIYRHYLDINTFPLDRKNEKRDRQCLGNYRPISLLPIVGFIKKTLFNTMFGIKPEDSCINKLWWICKSFDEELKVRDVFLGIY